jgi:hypothetical protein
MLDFGDCGGQVVGATEMTTPKKRAFALNSGVVWVFNGETPPCRFERQLADDGHG